METIFNCNSKGRIKRPVKVLQFGEGNFLRGFADWMIDIINEKTDFHGGIQIVQPLKKGNAGLINEQDGLYHIILEGLENGQKKQTFRLITSVNEAINPYESYKDYLQLGENPNLELIVSNTTESGIIFDDSNFDFAKIPNSFPGKLTALLYHRYQHFLSQPQKKITILPCELIENNGFELKKAVLQYTDHWELSSDFENWIETNIIFCNTLVDRIVPGFPHNRIFLENQLSFTDSLLVSAEIFYLWVIEGPETLNEQLKIKETNLNIIVTDNLKDYRTRKLRILNGAHTAMAAYGILNGFEKVNEIINDEIAKTFIKKIIFDEIIPTIDMPQQGLEDYAHTVLERFQNPFIQHNLIDIALNSVSKFKVRVLPSILAYIEKYHRVPEGLTSCFAYLIILYKGDYNTNPIKIKDDDSTIAFFKEAWQLANCDLTTTKILSNAAFWGEDLSKNIVLVNSLSKKIEELNGEISTLTL